jgi:membrane dipeptidase
MKLLPLLSLLLPLSQCYEQQQVMNANRYEPKDGSSSLDHANKLLRHHPLIDTHNDFPM